MPVLRAVTLTAPVNCLGSPSRQRVGAAVDVRVIRAVIVGDIYHKHYILLPALNREGYGGGSGLISYADSHDNSQPPRSRVRRWLGGER